MTCPDVSGNSNLLEGKPRESTILKSLVDGINQIIQDDLVDGACAVETQTSILTATGIWLDRIGERVRLTRPKIATADFRWFGFDGAGNRFDQANFIPGETDPTGIDDDSYRSLLIVRGSQLLTDCSIPSMTAIAKAAFGDSSNYIDNGDMSLDIIIGEDLADVVITQLSDAGLITKPAGVRINSVQVSGDGEVFGFDGNGFGFDQKNFIRLLEDL